MLNIKNIAEEKELDQAEMSAVKGGNSLFSNTAVNANLQAGGVSFASPQMNDAPVTQIDASQRTRAAPMPSGLAPLHPARSGHPRRTP